MRGAVGVADAIEAVGGIVTPGGGEAGGAAGLEGEGLDGIGIGEIIVTAQIVSP